MPGTVPAMALSPVQTLLKTEWAPAPEPTATDRRAVFDRLRDQWWPIVEEMRQLQSEYRLPTTAVARQAEIRTRFTELSSQSEAIVPLVARAALEAYCQDTTKNADLFDLLSTHIVDGVQHDRPEESLRFCQRMIDARTDSPMPAAWAAVLAVRLGDPEMAKQYLAVSDAIRIAASAGNPEDPATPENEKEMTAGDFLYAYLQMAATSDDYEVAYELAKLLVSIDYQGDWFPAFAGYAAYCVNDFDMAETQLKKAQEQKWLTPRQGDDIIAMARAALMTPLPNGTMHTLADSRKEWETESVIRAAEAAAGEADPEKALPRVKVYTNKGNVVVELFEDQAPTAVANFLTLVEKGYYANVPFHRVLPGFMAQGGDPDGTGGGGPGYCIRSEFTRPDARKHFRGTLSMARTEFPDTEGSQFFLCFTPTKSLDGNYTAFGRIVEGFDVLAKIQRVNPKTPDPTIVPDKILKAEVLHKRNHPYTFEKLPER